MKYRYEFLCCLVFALICLQMRNGQWYGDFWEHSAVVRELTTNIVKPTHPQLRLDAPHVFYSPYAIMVALLARTFESDNISILVVMGLINLVLWFFGLRLFVYSMVPQHRSAVCFYTLLLTLFWWGSFPWAGFGGFFHVAVLGYILPYPSTFALGIALIAIRLNQLRIETHRYIYFIPIFIFAVVALISHPITFLFLAISLISQSFLARDRTLFQLILIGGFLSVIVAAAEFWPYFPLREFLLFESGKFHFSNRLMYHEVMRKIWPALLGVPFLAMSIIKSGWRRPLLLMVAALSAIYALGGISERFAYGRSISYIVLLLHIIIAEHIAKLELNVHEAYRSNWFAQWIVTFSVTLISLLLFFEPLRFTLDRALRSYPRSYQDYQFLADFTGQYEVVLADVITSWMVPAFGGKVVVTEHPLAFVPDYDIRRRDVERFFSQELSLRERQRIVQKYKVNYLLLKKSSGQHLMKANLPEGRTIFENESLLLISLKQSIDD